MLLGREEKINTSAILMRKYLAKRELERAGKR
jgi:hypothetical protein